MAERAPPEAPQGGAPPVPPRTDAAGPPILPARADAAPPTPARADAAPPAPARVDAAPPAPARADAPQVPGRADAAPPVPGRTDTAPVPGGAGVAGSTPPTPARADDAAAAATLTGESAEGPVVPARSDLGEIEMEMQDMDDDGKKKAGAAAVGGGGAAAGATSSSAAAGGAAGLSAGTMGAIGAGAFVVLLGVVLVVSIPFGVKCAESMAVNDVSPPMTCLAQGERPVTVTGTGFMKIDVKSVWAGVKDRARGGLPTVKFGEQDLSGTFDPSDVTECTDISVKGRSVVDCKVAALTLPDTAATPRETRLYFENAEPCADENTAETNVFVFPPPEFAEALYAVAPPLTCLAQGNRSFFLNGSTFVRTLYAFPNIWAAPGNGTHDTVLHPLDTQMCTTGPNVAPADVRDCSMMNFTAIDSTLAAGNQTIHLKNPDPVLCETSAVVLTVFVPPALTLGTPSLTCVEQGDRAIALTGMEFVVLEDGSLPIVDFGGVSVTSVGARDCLPYVAVTETVQVCQTLDIIISSGSLAEGDQAVRVVNPGTIGCEVTTTIVTNFVPPSLSHVIPALICNTEKDRIVTLHGTDFIRLADGSLPIVEIDGQLVESVNASGCTDQVTAGAGGTVSVCTMVTVRIDQGLLSLGDVLVNITNPGSIVCESTGVVITVFPPPVLSSAEPALHCVFQSNRSITLYGAEFVRLDDAGGLLPIVEMNGVVVISEAVGDCVTQVTTDGDVSVCGHINVTIPAGSLAVGNVTTLIMNPGTLGCSDSEVISHVLDVPSLFNVDPPVMCDNQEDRNVLIHGSDFVQIGMALPAIRVASADVIEWDLQNCTMRATPAGEVPICTTINVTIAAGTMPTGDIEVWVQNPDPVECESTATIITSYDPPTVVSASPSILCWAEDTMTTITGTGFLDASAVGGGLPEVWINNISALSVDVHNCVVESTVQGDVRRCTGLNITIPAGASAGDTNATVRVRNSYGVLCAHEEVVLTFFNPIDVFPAHPEIVCDRTADTTLTICGAGFLAIPSSEPIVDVGGVPLVASSYGVCTPGDCGPATTCECYDVVSASGEIVPVCNALTVVVPGPASTVLTEPQMVSISVENTRAGSAVLPVPGYAIIPEAVVTVSQPPLFNNAQEINISMVGAGFVRGFPGVSTSVALQGPGGPLAVERPVSYSMCTPLVLEGGTAYHCLGAEITVPAGAYGLTIGQTLEAQVNTDYTTHSCGIATFTPVSTIVETPILSTVLPEVVCADTGARQITVTGQNFFRMTVTDELPTSNVGNVSSLDTSCSTFSTVIGDVETCDRAIIDVEEGTLTSGELTVTITNPRDTGTAAAPSTITVPPTVELIYVEPSVVCTIETAVVTLYGKGYLRGPLLGDMRAFINDVEFLENATWNNCTVLRAGLQSCDEYEFVVPNGTLAIGEANLTIDNLGTHTCDVTTSRPTNDPLRPLALLNIVPPPVVTLLTPTTICRDNKTIELSGTGFGPLSEVTMIAQTGENTGYTFNPPIISYEDTKLVAFVSEENPASQYEVRVRNSPTCETVSDQIFEIAAVVLVFYVSPAVVYTETSVDVRIGVTGLNNNLPKSVFLRHDTNPDVNITEGTVLRDANTIICNIPFNVTAGTYTIEVTSPTDCVGVLTNKFVVTNNLVLTLVSINPAFVKNDTATAVTLTATGEPLVNTPEAYASPVGIPGQRTVQLRAGVLVSATSMTGILPRGLTPGVYDIVVVNPGGEVDVLDGALTVVSTDLPVITDVLPTMMVTNEVTITGKGFAGGSWAAVCDIYATPFDGNFAKQAGCDTDTCVSGILNDANDGDICKLIFTSASGVVIEFFAVSAVNAASRKLKDFYPSASMNYPRRGHATTFYSPPNSQQKLLLALGGDSHTDMFEPMQNNSLVQVEVAEFDGESGTLLGFTERTTTLPTGRGFTRAEVCQNFIYLIGGFDGATNEATNSVYRAQILDPLKVPEIIISLDVEPDIPTTLHGGRWYYRVSAVFPGDDPSNPSGESPGSELLSIELPNLVGMRLLLTWDVLPGASGYRLYRTEGNDTSVSTMGLLRTFDGNNNTKFIDLGYALTEPSSAPLPKNSLGAWHEISPMITKRYKHVTGLVDWNDGTCTLYAAGGYNEAGVAVDSIEAVVLTVDDSIALSGGNQSKATTLQTYSAWADSGDTLSEARAGMSSRIITARNHDQIPVGEYYMNINTGVASDEGAAKVYADQDTSQDQLRLNPDGTVSTNNIGRNTQQAWEGYCYNPGGTWGSILLAGWLGGTREPGKSNDWGTAVPPAYPYGGTGWNFQGGMKASKFTNGGIEAPVYPSCSMETIFMIMTGGHGTGGATANTYVSYCCPET